MIRIAITPERPLDSLEREAAMIEAVLDAGWDAVHLRHPSASLSVMRRLMGLLPEACRRRVRIHDHQRLLDEFGDIGGVHLNHRNPAPPPGFAGSISRSCHSVDEVMAARGLDYVTLSPVFDSISKQGYRAAFSDADLERLADGQRPRVIALGGVTVERIGLIERYSFDGFAVLGALPWDASAAAMAAEARRFVAAEG